MSVVLYRKYRPQKFSEIVGQDHIVKTLKGAIDLGNIAHAYLFCGSRGIGKTSIARIFAKELETVEHDIYEIDAASNNGVDEIRSLNEAVCVLPFSSKYKVYILDEVHMLSKPAFNALLKTLEEPPSHVIFILATTEEHKVPETISSRCQVFNFSRPSPLVIRQVIEKTAKEEGFALERSSADLISLLAEGSFRDALGILQKIMSASKDMKVSVGEVEQITGAPKGEMINSFLESLGLKKSEDSLKVVSEISKSGLSSKLFLMLAISKCRLILLSRYAPSLAEKMEESMTQEDWKFVQKLSKDVNIKLDSKVLSRLIDALTDSEYTPAPTLSLELAVFDICIN